MKTIILYLIFAACASSCSTTDENSTESAIPIAVNKLKAYNKNIAYYSYSIDPSKNGMYRIYLDTISNIITQYTSPQGTNQSNKLESFRIKSTTSYPNYKNTNITYLIYDINGYEVNNVATDIKLAPAKLFFSHEIYTDTFVFKRLSVNDQIIFSNDYPNGEYYKKLN